MGPVFIYRDRLQPEGSDIQYENLKWKNGWPIVKNRLRDGMQMIQITPNV